MVFALKDHHATALLCSELRSTSRLSSGGEIGVRASPGSMGIPHSLPVQQDLESPSSLSWPSLDFEAEETASSLKMILGFSQAACLLQGKESTDLH